MADVLPAENVERKPALRFAENVDFLFLNKYLDYKLTTNKCKFRCCSLTEKLTEIREVESVCWL